MKRLLFAVVLALILTGCDSYVIEGRKAYKQYFEKTLKDPSSLVIHNETFEKDGNVTVKWTIDMGAKNSYGGMIRETYKFTTVGSKLYEVNGKLYFE